VVGHSLSWPDFKGGFYGRKDNQKMQEIQSDLLAGSALPGGKTIWRKTMNPSRGSCELPERRAMSAKDALNPPWRINEKAGA